MVKSQHLCSGAQRRRRQLEWSGIAEEGALEARERPEGAACPRLEAGTGLGAPDAAGGWAPPLGAI